MTASDDPAWVEAFEDRPDVERELGALLADASDDASFRALLDSSETIDVAARRVAHEIVLRASPSAVVWAAELGLQQILVQHLAAVWGQPPSDGVR